MLNEERINSTTRLEFTQRRQYKPRRITILRLKNGLRAPLALSLLPHPSARAPLDMTGTMTPAESTFSKLEAELRDKKSLLSAFPFSELKWVKQNEARNALSYRIDLGRVKGANGSTSRLAAYCVLKRAGKSPDILLQYVDGLEPAISKFVSKKMIHELSWVEGPVGVLSSWDNNRMNAVLKVYFLLSKEVSHEIQHEFPINDNWKKEIPRACRYFGERAKEVARDQALTAQPNNQLTAVNTGATRIIGAFGGSGTGASGRSIALQQQHRSSDVTISSNPIDKVQHVVRNNTIKQLRDPTDPAIRRVFDVTSPQIIAAPTRRKDRNPPSRVNVPPTMAPGNPIPPSLRHYDNAVLDQDLFGIIDPLVGDVRTASGPTFHTSDRRVEVELPGNNAKQTPLDVSRNQHNARAPDRSSVSDSLRDGPEPIRPTTPGATRGPFRPESVGHGASTAASTSENFESIQKEILQTFKDERVLFKAITKDQSQLKTLAGRDLELDAQKEAFLAQYKTDKDAIESERAHARKRLAQNEDVVRKEPEKRSRLCDSLSYDEVIKVGIELGKGLRGAHKDGK